MAWGSNAYGQTSVPVGLSGVVAVAAGGSHSLALKVDGTVIAWGNDVFGQVAVPVALAQVTAISAGYYHTLALVSDSTRMYEWGDYLDHTGDPPLGGIDVGFKPSAESGWDGDRLGTQ